ncbi:hypothetical protein [Streptomyces sp. NPDC059816]|uniref:hypothetical protein n=1 Tax=Streptomyces sp. NPDC059816 TaxID=3346960 RepID=UPI00365A9D52
MTSIPLAGPPASVTGPLNDVLGMVAWVATAAGVMGVLIVGMRMAISLRHGDGQEHLVQFSVVMGACILAASAGPLVSLFV